jgi:hypothetical protein
VSATGQANAEPIPLPAGVGTDVADLALRQVEADRAAADRRLDLADRVGQPQRLFLAAAQDVMREPFRRLAADARQGRELVDQVPDRRPIGMRRAGDGVPCVHDLQT